LNRRIRNRTYGGVRGAESYLIFPSTRFWLCNLVLDRIYSSLDHIYPKLDRINLKFDSEQTTNIMKGTLASTHQTL
ncbi:hypothetical protein, partial [Oceanobacillus polygoni]